MEELSNFDVPVGRKLITRVYRPECLADEREEVLPQNSIENFYFPWTCHRSPLRWRRA